MPRRFTLLVALSFALCCAFCSPSAKAQSIHYKFTDLGNIAQDGPVAPLINNSGEIIATQFDKRTGRETPMIWRNGSWLPLRLPAGEIPSGSVLQCEVVGINSSGQIIGTALAATPKILKQEKGQGLDWIDDNAPPDEMIQIPPGEYVVQWSAGGAPRVIAKGKAVGIDDKGDILILRQKGKKAFLWRNGSETPAAPDFTASSLDLSPSGILYGYLDQGEGDGDVGMLKNGHLVVLPLQSAGDFLQPVYMGSDGALLVSGSQPGDNSISGDGRDYIYKDGVLEQLCRARLSAYNKQGIYVGILNNKTAVIYRDGKLHNLADLTTVPEGIHLLVADAINDAGQIVGQGTRSNGSDMAFLLTPEK